MRLDDVEVFVEAIKAGSLAGAARRLSMSAMAASRCLNNLEAELGVRLVHRTTRSLSPTSDGEVFLPHAQALLEDKSNALADLFPDGASLSGRLRITASAAFGRKIIAPMLPDFMRQHPALQVDLLATDEQVDIVGTWRYVSPRCGTTVWWRIASVITPVTSAPAQRIWRSMAIRKRSAILRRTAA